MTPEEIIQLPPELRELRSWSPPGHVKKIASTVGPIKLSPPTNEPVTEAELTPVPYHRSRPEDIELLGRLPTGSPPSLPAVTNGFTDEQRYLFDTHGYVQVAILSVVARQCCVSLKCETMTILFRGTQVPNVLGPDELAECRAAVQDYISTPSEAMPPGFGQTPGKKWLHAFAWSPTLERL